MAFVFQLVNNRLIDLGEKMKKLDVPIDTDSTDVSGNFFEEWGQKLSSK